jgi:hypothetical protein
VQKKTLVNNLKTNKKAIIAGKSTGEAKLSAKVMPRSRARITAQVNGGLR